MNPILPITHFGEWMVALVQLGYVRPFTDAKDMCAALYESGLAEKRRVYHEGRWRKVPALKIRLLEAILGRPLDWIAMGFAPRLLQPTSREDGPIGETA